jgi:hypothetical protein
MPKGKSKLKPETLEKEAKVLELRRGGLPFDLIAARVGYASASGAYNAWKRGLDRIVYQDVVETRNMEIDRLDIAQAAIWGDIVNTSATPEQRARAILTYIKIAERRAKLLGLDMPTKAEIEVNIYERDTIDAEVKRLVALLDSEQASAMDAPTGAPRAITNGE